MDKRIARRVPRVKKKYYEWINEYCEWENKYYGYYEWSNEYYEWPDELCKDYE